MQEVDKHGKPKDDDKYRHTWGKLSLGDSGEIEYVPVKVIKNGEDITEEEQAKERERQEKEDEEDSEGFTTEGYTPFNAKVQDRMSIERLDKTEMVDGKALIVYKFVEHPDDGPVPDVPGAVRLMEFSHYSLKTLSPRSPGISIWSTLYSRDIESPGDEPSHPGQFDG